MNTLTPITNEQRDAAYASATPQQHYLYAAPASGQYLWKLAENHNLTENQLYANFTLLIGDVILGLRSRAELPNLLTESLNLSFEQAIKITGDLIDFLDQPVAPVAPEDLSTDIAEAEAALEAIPQMRTMPQDMAEAQEAQAVGEVTYTSTQAALLNESKQAEPIAIPQWESEQS